MEIERPVTTLFMLMSVDGKISTGQGDSLDFDKDLPKTQAAKGLSQYYEIEQTTDLFSLNSGKVMEKIGINDRNDIPDKSPVSFIIIDNKPHLKEGGITYLCKRLKSLFVITTNERHCALFLEKRLDNLKTLVYKKLNLQEILCDLKKNYGVGRITIQSGGTLNSEFLRNKLIDYIHIIVAPILVGGKDTPTLIDGDSITDIKRITGLAALELTEINILKHSYVELKYKVRTDLVLS